MKNLGFWIGTIGQSFNNRKQDMDDSISSIEDTIEEMNSLVTETKKFLT